MCVCVEPRNQNSIVIIVVVCALTFDTTDSKVAKRKVQNENTKENKITKSLNETREREHLQERKEKEAKEAATVAKLLFFTSSPSFTSSLQLALFFFARTTFFRSDAVLRF
jgi:uncharacterized membrane protein